MSRGLVDLPVELVLSIVEWACEDETPQTIHKMLLVNRLFYRLVLPYLYKRLSDEELLANSDSSTKLLLNLLFDPTKRELVHELDLMGYLESIDSEELGKASDSPYTEKMQVEIHRLVELVLRYEERHEIQELWRNNFLNKPSKDAFRALALMCLPNLKELGTYNSNVDFFIDYGYVDEGLSSASKHPESGISRPFAKLEKLTWGGDGNKYPYNSYPLVFAARWPSLKEISCSELGDSNHHEEDADPRFLELEPKSSNLTSISLRTRCKLSGEHLIRYLRSVKALEYFDYEIGHSWAWIPISTLELTSALDHHKSTLKSITLDLLDGENEDENNVFVPMNFSDYTALETLDIAYDLLFPADPNHTPNPNPDVNTRDERVEEHLLRALPQSLKSLTISRVESMDRVYVVYNSFDTLLGCTNPSNEAEFTVPHLRSAKMSMSYFPEGEAATGIGAATVQRYVLENSETTRKAKERGMKFLGIETWSRTVNVLKASKKKRDAGESISGA